MPSSGPATPPRSWRTSLTGKCGTITTGVARDSGRVGGRELAHVVCFRCFLVAKRGRKRVQSFDHERLGLTPLELEGKDVARSRMTAGSSENARPPPTSHPFFCSRVTVDWCNAKRCCIELPAQRSSLRTVHICLEATLGGQGLFVASAAVRTCRICLTAPANTRYSRATKDEARAVVADPKCQWKGTPACMCRGEGKRVCLGGVGLLWGMMSSRGRKKETV